MKLYKDETWQRRCELLQEWKESETCEDNFTIMEIGQFGNYDEIFTIAAEQMTPEPSSTVFKDDFLFEFYDPLSNWIEWLKAQGFDKPTS